MSVWILDGDDDDEGACFSRFAGVKGRSPDDRLSRLMIPVRLSRDCLCDSLRLKNVASRKTRPAMGHKLNDGELIVLLRGDDVWWKVL